MSSRITILSFFLLIAIVCAAISSCSKRRQQPQLQIEQKPQTASLPAAPPEGPPETRPPQPAEAQEAIRRIYGQAVFVESNRPKFFIAGDFNGDGYIDLGVIVRPTPGQIARLNSGVANWIRCDPQKVKPPVPQKHGRIFIHMEEPPVVIEERDLLLAVVHGYGPQGWRNPQARQSYLLKNVVGDGIELTPFKEAIKIVRKYKDPPQLRGDVVSETLDNKQGLLYYTGAKYAWRRLGTTGP
ncbi:MAG: hypothetical protein J2P52_10035 [Blastocatellia bacterium]|nr:hypothetical protein [Blastocatellia bacterium]